MKTIDELKADVRAAEEECGRTKDEMKKLSRERELAKGQLSKAQHALKKAIELSEWADKNGYVPAVEPMTEEQAVELRNKSCGFTHRGTEQQIEWLMAYTRAVESRGAVAKRVTRREATGVFMGRCGNMFHHEQLIEALDEDEFINALSELGVEVCDD